MIERRVPDELEHPQRLRLDIRIGGETNARAQHGVYLAALGLAERLLLATQGADAQDEQATHQQTAPRAPRPPPHLHSLIRRQLRHSFSPAAASGASAAFSRYFSVQRIIRRIISAHGSSFKIS